MTGKRGRPRNSEDVRWQHAQTARRTVDEELAEMRGCGLNLHLGAIGRAARRLKISPRTLKRRLALAPAADPDERLTWDEWQEIAQGDADMARWEAQNDK